MPDFSIENQHGRLNGALIAGVDEAGRGPLAGPVVAGAVIWKHDCAHDALWAQIDDSKKLTAKRRAKLCEAVKDCAIWSVGIASVEEIDTFNILQATVIAMQRAVSGLAHAPSLCLIDGSYTPKKFPAAIKTVVKGDSLSLSIAAASIIAKVTRDVMMEELHAAYPQYGWLGNAGYGTAAHLAALAEHGATPHHRRSFAPIRDRLAAA